jgi:hypothetical protein
MTAQLVTQVFRHTSGALAKEVGVTVVTRNTNTVVESGITNRLGELYVYLEPGLYDWLVSGERIPFTVTAPDPTTSLSRYSHHQVGAASSWPITHNLNAWPDPVVLLDSDPDSPVMTDIEYVNANTLIIVFPTPVTGWAHL